MAGLWLKLDEVLVPASVTMNDDRISGGDQPFLGCGEWLRQQSGKN